MSKPNIIAIIRETECIGCTKCIEACPVDAILGANKYMHTVIANECIGCQLCIPPCPVDCIELITQPATHTREVRKQHALERIATRKQRLAQIQQQSQKPTQPSLSEKKNYIEAALLRVQAKKS